MGDYFAHWLSFAQRTDRAKLPKIYFVNWFRKNANGRWLWPGYGENSRVLKWICERVEGTGKAQKTPIGNLPTPDALDFPGWTCPPVISRQLLAVDPAGWKKEAEDVAANYAQFDGKLPNALVNSLKAPKAPRLSASPAFTLRHGAMSGRIWLRNDLRGGDCPCGGCYELGMADY